VHCELTEESYLLSGAYGKEQGSGRYLLQILLLLLVSSWPLAQIPETTAPGAYMQFFMPMLLPALFREFEKKYSESNSQNSSQPTMTSNSYDVMEVHFQNKPLSSHHFSLS